MSKSKEYIEGQKAFCNQKSLPDNPYDGNKAGASRIAFYDWEKGWSDESEQTTSATLRKKNNESYCDRFKPHYDEVKKALQQLGFEDFIKVTEAMYAEYKEKDGTISCDNSTKGLHLDLKMKFLSLMSMIDERPIGYWIVYWCDTCEGHNADHPYHCEIVRNK